MFLVTIDTTETVAMRLADDLADGEALGCEAAGAFDIGGGRWRVEAYCRERPTDAELAGYLTAMLGFEAGTAIERVLLRPVAEDADGAAALAPVRAGRFRLYGEHNTPDPAGLGRFDLAIAAETAFGTGDHASTLLALAALDRISRRRRLGRVLDLGCGTGVLALAAARLGARRVVASDIDPVAVRMSRYNARVAGLAPRLTILEADGTRAAAIRAVAPYDLILANILPDPLVALAPGIVASLGRGGLLVLAGLRSGEQPRLEAAYRTRGLRLVARETIKEWAGLVLARA
ncbi:MAG: 50S ribosomal protein L11 methyltransferase [Hyphomicrobiaceae bacterium]|nr:50S ribosomal protein L11 methyltransferase [Hyphomicrobiaceae bacterium]